MVSVDTLRYVSPRESSDQVSRRALRQVRMDARRRDEAKVGTLARSATMQTPNLTQPDNIRLLRGTGALWADVCVGSSLCRPATRRPRPLALDPNRPGRACETRSELP